MHLFKHIKILWLDQATVLPYLTYLLAMDGCRVIRLEHPVFGDPNRMVGESFLEGEERMNSYFMAINAGKEALTLNLADPRGQETLGRPREHHLVVDRAHRRVRHVWPHDQTPRQYPRILCTGFPVPPRFDEHNAAIPG